MHQHVEFLLRRSQLDIGVELHGVVRRQQRIEQLVHGNRQILIEARTKILALEHPRQPIVAAEPHHIVARHLPEPFAVVANFARQRRPRFGLSRGIANHRGKVTDQENGRVAHILKMFQLAQHDGVSQMNIRRGRIHAEIRPQRFPRLRRLLELRAHLAFRNDFRRALFQVRQLLVNGFEFRGWHLIFSGLFCD